MLSEDIGGCTEYSDIADNIKEVKHSVILSVEDRKEIEERIIEELYKIFTHKAI